MTDISGDTESLEDMLAFCARRAVAMAEIADAIDPATDPYGHAVTAANNNVLGYLKETARIGTALGKIRSHKISEVRVYRQAQPPAAPAIHTPRTRPVVTSSPPPPQFAFETKDPKTWTRQDEEEWERENDRQWDEIEQSLAKTHEARIAAGTHVRLADGQVVEIPEGETADTVLAAARAGDYGPEAAAAAFAADVRAETLALTASGLAETAGAGQGEGDPLSISEGTNAGK